MSRSTYRATISTESPRINRQFPTLTKTNRSRPLAPGHCPKSMQSYRLRLLPVCLHAPAPWRSSSSCFESPRPCGPWLCFGVFVHGEVGLRRLGVVRGSRRDNFVAGARFNTVACFSAARVDAHGILDLDHQTVICHRGGALGGGTRPNATTIAAGQGIVLVIDDEESVSAVAKQIFERRGFADRRRRARRRRDFLHPLERYRSRAARSNDASGWRRYVSAIAPYSPRRQNDSIERLQCARRHESLCRKGLAGFIQKPYRVRALLETVREVLEGPKPGKLAVLLANPEPEATQFRLHFSAHSR